MERAVQLTQYRSPIDRHLYHNYNLRQRLADIYGPFLECIAPIVQGFIRRRSRNSCSSLDRGCLNDERWSADETDPLEPCVCRMNLLDGPVDKD